MKRLFIILCFCVRAYAQTTLTLEADTPWTLAFDHTAVYTTKILTNGVLFVTVNSNLVACVATNATNFTYAVAIPALPARDYAFTAISVRGDGLESGESLPLAVQFKPRKPGNLRRFVAVAPAVAAAAAAKAVTK